jgi:hypothetical protein
MPIAVLFETTKKKINWKDKFELAIQGVVRRDLVI